MAAANAKQLQRRGSGRGNIPPTTQQTDLDSAVSLSNECKGISISFSDFIGNLSLNVRIMKDFGCFVGL